MTTFTARTPEDILAAVPVVLGFHPERSAVMLTLGGALPFHARVDLPPAEGGPGPNEVVDQLLEPARQHGVELVVFVIYDRDVRVALPFARALEDAFEEAGIGVIETLLADGHHWFPVARGRSPAVGAPYDVTAHRFLVESVVSGVVTHGSREELAASLDPDPEAVARVTALLGRPASAGDVVAAVERHAATGTVPDDAELAGLLPSLVDPPVRDASWFVVRRETSAAHVRLWCDVVRRAPTSVAASPLVLLAATAWMAGQGAVAWCALDRLFEVDPEHSLGILVGQLLAGAVPPTMADAVWEDYLTEMGGGSGTG